jgi:hypothetical protein
MPPHTGEYNACAAIGRVIRQSGSVCGKIVPGVADASTVVRSVDMIRRVEAVSWVPGSEF